LGHGRSQGVDLSQLGTEDADGTDPPFKAAPGGPTTDALVLLRSRGANTFRMRMWNDPCAETWYPDGLCDKSKWSYGNLTGVLKMARRVKAANLTFVLDLHYSDWWADPGKQRKPAAWDALPFDGLVSAVHDFTQQTVAALVAQGTPPYAVQIGNEISNGFLWNNATSNEPCSAGGRLFCSTAPEADWQRFAALVGAGIGGARSACSTTKIAIHTDLGNHIITKGIDYVIDWYTNLTIGLNGAGGGAGGGGGGRHFDLIGLSMYPQWDGGGGGGGGKHSGQPKHGKTFESVALLPKLAEAFESSGQRIYIAETAYPAAGPTQPEANFTATPEGQMQYLQALRDAVADALGPQRNGGVLWWEGKECGGWNSLFDEGCVARPVVLSAFE
jgi:arabinogalactan endo-1,4-beta-galactosidase